MLRVQEGQGEIDSGEDEAAAEGLSSTEHRLITDPPMMRTHPSQRLVAGMTPR